MTDYKYGIIKRTIDIRTTREKISYASPWAGAQFHVDCFYTSPSEDPLFLWLFFNNEDALTCWIEKHTNLKEIELHTIFASIIFLSEDHDYIYVDDNPSAPRTSIDPSEDSFLKRLEWIQTNQKRLNLEIPDWLKQIYADMPIILQGNIFIEYTAEQYN